MPSLIISVSWNAVRVTLVNLIDEKNWSICLGRKKNKEQVFFTSLENKNTNTPTNKGTQNIPIRGIRLGKKEEEDFNISTYE